VSSFPDREIPREPEVIEPFKKLVGPVRFLRIKVAAGHMLNQAVAYVLKLRSLGSRAPEGLSLQVAKELEQQGDV